MDPILATIVWFSGNFAPLGFLYCNGDTLPIQRNEALFSLVGTYYGGDGRTNFKLPDLRPDVIEYQITKDENGNEKVVAVVKGKRAWRPDEPKCLIASQGVYPSRP
jgi:microcystin-dependent protein